MSNLLKEAIIDAKALREAALKSAESEIINKYSTEVGSALDRLLEQDDLGADLGDTLGGEDLGADLAGDLGGDLGGEEEGTGEDILEDVPLAATDGFSGLSGTGLSGIPGEGEEIEVNVNLDALQEAIQLLETELGENTEWDFDEDSLSEMLNEEEEEEESTEYGSSDASQGAASAAETSASSEQDEEAIKGMEESFDFSEAMIEDIVEKLAVDMGADLSGWAGSPDFKQAYQIKKELAHRRTTDVEEELEVTKKAYEELVFENKQLKEHLSQYKQATTELKEGLQDVNLSNARLLYTNRVLRNTSLNERQKERIVEAISRAGSVTEARTMFDTLQSTVEAKPKQSPQSLSEAITRRSSVIRASRQESTSSDPFQERMKRLAGIK